MRDRPTIDDFYYTDGISSHYHVISDMRDNEDCQATTFAQHATWARFYCSVPLRCSGGSVLGAFTIMDDRPRYGISEDELLFLEDMSDSVTEHLHSIVVRAQRQRSDRLIQALGLFNRGKGTLRDWFLGQEDSRREHTGRHAENNVLSPMQRKAFADSEFGVQESLSDGNEGSSQESRNLRNKQSRPSLRSRKSKTAGKTSRNENFDLSAETDRTYARASNLIREALSADGVVFVDAHTISATLQGLHSNDSESGTKSTSESEGSTTSHDGPSQPICKTNGFSIRQDTSAATTRPAEQFFNLPASSLRHLIKRYPAGGR